MIVLDITSVADRRWNLGSMRNLLSTSEGEAIESILPPDSMRCDTSWTKSSSRLGLSVVVRDNYGALITCTGARGVVVSLLDTEFKGAFLAMEMAMLNNLTRVLFKSDSAELALNINGTKSQSRWSISPILIQIRSIQFLKWSWILPAKRIL